MSKWFWPVHSRTSLPVVRQQMEVFGVRLCQAHPDLFVPAAIKVRASVTHPYKCAVGWKVCFDPSQLWYSTSSYTFQQLSDVRLPGQVLCSLLLIAGHLLVGRKRETLSAPSIKLGQISSWSFPGDIIAKPLKRYGGVCNNVLKGFDMDDLSRHLSLIESCNVFAAETELIRSYSSYSFCSFIVSEPSTRSLQGVSSVDGGHPRHGQDDRPVHLSFVVARGSGGPKGNISGEAFLLPRQQRRHGKDTSSIHLTFDAH